MKKVTVLLLLAITLVTSCKKEKLLQEGGSLAGKSLLKKSLNNAPDNKGGRLFFKSEEDLRSYYNFLSEKIESLEEDDENFEVDNFLLEIENSLSFISYRQHLITNYDWKDKEFNQEEIDELAKIDFIIDDVRKSILNEYMEVGIGEYVYVYFSENQVYKIPSKNEVEISALRAIIKGDDFIQPFDVLGREFELISSKIMLSRKDLFGEADYEKNGFYEHFYTNSTMNNINCNIYTKLFSGELKRNYYDTIDSLVVAGDYYDANLIAIDFGDGTDVVVNNSAQIYNSHTYSNVGSFNVKFTYEFYDSYNDLTVMEDEFTVVVGGACTDANESINRYQDDGTWELATKVWVKKDFFGKHLAAYSHSWKKNWRGNWKREKANLFCRVEGVFRGGNCNVQENLAKSKARRTKKLRSKKHRLFKNYDIENGDCKSAHSFGGGSWYQELILNPCD